MSASDPVAATNRGERVVWQRRFVVTPRWLWLVQRATALLLAPLIALHVAAPRLATNPVVLVLLIVSIASHGYGGLVRYGAPVRRRVTMKVLAIAWTAIVVGVGGWIVIAA